MKTLPKDHWLTQGGHHVPPMPFRTGTDNPKRESLKRRLEEAARYAICVSTGNGSDMDFNPDSMVKDFVLGCLGYYTPTGLSHLEGLNPDRFRIIQAGTSAGGQRLAETAIHNRPNQEESMQDHATRRVQAGESNRINATIVAKPKALEIEDQLEILRDAVKTNHELVEALYARTEVVRAPQAPGTERDMAVCKTPLGRELCAQSTAVLNMNSVLRGILDTLEL